MLWLPACAPGLETPDAVTILDTEKDAEASLCRILQRLLVIEQGELQTTELSLDAGCLDEPPPRLLHHVELGGCGGLHRGRCTERCRPWSVCWQADMLGALPLAPDRFLIRYRLQQR